MNTKPTAPAATPGLLDVLTPQALEFGARQVTFGDQSARVLLVTDYPPRVGPAWLARIARLPDVVLSAHVVLFSPRFSGHGQSLSSLLLLEIQPRLEG